MLPVTPTTSGSKRRRQDAATACSARSGSATSTTVTSPSASSAGLAGGRVREAADEEGRGTRARRPPRGSGGRPSARRPAPRTATRAPRAGSRRPRPPPRRSLRRRRVPPVAATRSSAVRHGPTPSSVRAAAKAVASKAVASASPGRRPGESGTVDRPGSVTSRSVAQADAGHGAAATGCRRRRPAASGTRYGVLIASWATRRNSSKDITGISRWPRRTTVGVPSSIRTADHQVRVTGLPPDVADERVVEAG